MTHLKSVSKHQPVAAQSLESFGKSVLQGFLFGINPIVLFLASEKISSKDPAP